MLKKIRAVRSWKEILAFGLLSLITSTPVLADVVYTYPDIQRCMFPQANAPCVAEPAEAAYPIRNPESGTDYRGCYDKTFNRRSDIPAGGKCTSANAPIRVEIAYFTRCDAAMWMGDGSKGCPAGRVCCTRESKVIVRPKIIGYAAGVDVKMTASLGNGTFTGVYGTGVVGGMDPITLDPGQSGDAAYDSCRAIKEMGYNWDPVNRTCNIDAPRQCQRLGFVWEGTRCVNKCDASLCKKNFCQGYVYQPDDQSCVCIGKSTTTDHLGAPCIETTSTPTSTPTTCAALVTVVNSEKGQTVTGTFAPGGRVATMNIGGNKNRSENVSCKSGEEVTSLTFSFSNILPAMCVRCDGAAASCGHSSISGTTPSCTIPALTDGGNYYAFIYPQGGNAAPTPTPSVRVTSCAGDPFDEEAYLNRYVDLRDVGVGGSWGSACLHYSAHGKAEGRNGAPNVVPTALPTPDLSVTTLNVTYPTQTWNTLKSGVSTATVSYVISNPGTTAANAKIFLTGPISGCTSPGTVSVPAGGIYTSPAVTCTINGPPGKHCGGVAFDYLDGEDPNQANNTKTREMQICQVCATYPNCPLCNAAVTVGADACP